MGLGSLFNRIFSTDASGKITEIPDQAELVLYKFDRCPYCRRAMAAIDELGLQVSYKDTRQNPHFREELIQKGGKSQVPCLFINGTPLYESRDIIRSLKAYVERQTS